MKILFLCAAGFLAAFVDSIAGGGGLISLPSFLIAGLNPYFALGTNKFASTTASFTSSIKFASSGKINKRLMTFLAPFTLLGAALGVKTVLRINKKFLSFLVLIMILSVSMYSLFSKNIGKKNNFEGLTKINVPLGMLLAFILGFYDGFFGPGTGSFLIFGMMYIFKFDFVNAAGNSKFLNFISNITSLLMFALNKRIFLLYGIPAAIFMIIGAKAGTELAINKASLLLPPIFLFLSICVSILLVFHLYSMLSPPSLLLFHS